LQAGFARIRKINVGSNWQLANGQKKSPQITLINADQKQISREFRE
jgi:hypothetical protein